MQAQAWLPTEAAWDSFAEPRFRRLQSDGDAPQQVVAVILTVDDPNALAIDPKTGKVVLASEVDTSLCIKLADGSPFIGDGGAGNSTSGSPLSAPAPAPGPTDATSYKQTQSVHPNVQFGSGEAPHITVRNLLGRLLKQQQETQGSGKSAPLSLEAIVNAVKSVEVPEAVVDVSLCGGSMLAVVAATDVIKVRVKVNAVASSLPAGALNVVNGQTTPLSDGSCGQPPCPYIEGPWSVFEVSAPSLPLFMTSCFATRPRPLPHRPGLSSTHPVQPPTRRPKHLDQCLHTL
jgi:hypothetical protein